MKTEVSPQSTVHGPQSTEPVSEILQLLDQASELVEKSKLSPQRVLPIPNRQQVNAMMRRFKRDRDNYPHNDCSANRAGEAARVAARYLGLNHEQAFFFYSFVSEVASISHSRGVYDGMNYDEVKVRRERLKQRHSRQNAGSTQAVAA